LRKTVRAAVYSLLPVPLFAAIWLGAFVLQERVTNHAAPNSPSYIGAIPVGGPGSQNGQYQRLLNSVAAVAPPIEHEPVDQSVVSPADLKKITLFDVSVRGYKSSISGIYGRVRNGLARAVHRVGIKALFYSAEGEVIEVRTFLMKCRAAVSRDERVLPNTPISFDENLPVDHLPEGYTCQLEVTEARYAN
jgi:hypothetical protein